MDDKLRLEKFLATHGATADDVATLWAGGVDDVSAVLAGLGNMTGRHRALLVLFGSAHKEARQSALKHLRDTGDAEYWRVIPGFTKYEASNTGRIRRRVGGAGASPLRVLKQTPRPDGYLRVTLYDDSGRMFTKQSHRIVCTSMHGELDAMHACHKDGNRLNNHADNLYWGTAAENAADRVRHKAQRDSILYSHVGEKTETKQKRMAIKRLYATKKINWNKQMQLLAEL